MLDLLISGKTRIKLLTKFFLAPEIQGHLRGLAEEFGESTNAIRLELNRFEEGGLLISDMEQNRKVFRANQRHPLFGDIRNIIRKHVGLDHLIENVLDRLGGKVREAYITGDMAVGRDNRTINLLLVGEEINTRNLEALLKKAEALIHRRIEYTIASPADAGKQIRQRKDTWKIWGE